MLKPVLFIKWYVLLLVLCSACSNPDPVKNNNNASNTSLDLELKHIKLPPGFSISIYADNVKGARSMCWGNKGTLFVGTRKGSVYALVDENRDGAAEKIYTIAKGLHSPNGVAFRNGSLYVAEISRVICYDSIESHLADPLQFRVINDHFPTDEHHGWKYIAFGPDGKLYVPVGAPCNICEPDSNRYACITRMNPDGSGWEVYARGIRNTVGFDWMPGAQKK